MGLLDDQNHKKYQQCHSSYLEVFKHSFEMLQDQDYSIAVNWVFKDRRLGELLLCRLAKY